MATEQEPRPTRAATLDHKPMMTSRQIIMMNFGFFGIQYSFGLQQTAINPISASSAPTRMICRCSTWPGRSPA